jgi:hypothetical protein
MRQVIAEMMMEFLKSDVGMWDVTSTMVDEKKVRARVIATYGNQGRMALQYERKILFLNLRATRGISFLPRGQYSMCSCR